MTIAIAIKMDKYRGIVTDTALVCETTDGNYIRTGETEDKVFLKDDSAIFCSGCMGVCNHIRRYILEMKDFSIEKVVDYLKYLNSIDPISNDDMAIIIIDKDKITGIKANNNFEPTYFEGDSIVSTGIFMVNNKEISSEEGNALANSKFINYILETRNVSKALVKTAKEFLNTKVGGKLKLFTYDELKKFELSYTEKVDNLLENNREKAKQISNNKLFKPARYKTWLDYDDIDYSTFNGNIDASKITGSILNGGSINIGDKFIVDLLGNTTIKAGSLNIDNRFIVERDGTVKINKGELDINSNFIVDQLGNVAMNGTLNIADKLTVDVNGDMTIHGGSISWASSDPKIATAQNIADTAMSEALDAQSMANNANVIATSASGNISKLANGTYTGGTFINGTTISSPNIEGGIIAGGEFCDLDKKAKLVLNPTNSSSKNADLNLYSGDNVALRIFDQIGGSVDLSSYNSLFLRTGQFGTYAFGNWDFSNAEIKGIDTVAKFA